MPVQQGSEVEQLMYVTFQGVELALRLSGSGIKNLAQLIIAASKDDGRLNMRRGEVRDVASLLRENKPLVTYKIDIDDIKRFRQLSKQYGLLYTVVKDAKSEDFMCTVILKEEEVPMLNNIIKDMGLQSIFTAKDDKKKDDPSKDSSDIISKSTEGMRRQKSNSKDIAKESTLGKLEKYKDSLNPKDIKVPKKDITR